MDSRSASPLLIITLAISLLGVARAQPVYLLDVREAGSSWTIKDLLAARIAELTRGSGFNVTLVVVDSIEEWENLVMEGPQGAVIVNAHGELVPVPPSYGDDWRGFYRDLALLIYERGWVFINPVGYGFYYVSYNYTRRSDGAWSYSTLTVGEDGLSFLGGWIGMVATAWPPQTGSPSITELGRRVFDALGFDMPESGLSNRPITTDYPPLWSFYELGVGNVSAYSCAAFRTGLGMLVWGGLGNIDTELQARAASAMLLYVLYPEIPTLPPKPKGITPTQLTLILWGGFIVVGVLILAYIVLRSGAD